MIEKTNLIFKGFIGVLILFLVYGCSDSGEDSLVEQDPVIDFVKVNPNWNLASESYNKVEAKIIDPQGVENIDSVSIVITDSIGQVVVTDQLYDDGAYFHTNDGDVIAGDAIFTNCYDAGKDLGEIAGRYEIEIQAFDLEGNISEPSDANVNVGYSYPREFAYIQLPDTLQSGSNAAFIFAALSQTEGVQAIDNVYFNLYISNSDDLLESEDMYNNGDIENTGDAAAEDSIFSYKLDYTFAAERKGFYDFEFVINDIFGVTTASDRFPIYLENNPGEIIALNIPESMQRPPTVNSYNRELITVDVSDPQGITDIDSVYFLSLKPDGNYANNGNPIILVDNGLPFNIDNPAEEAGDAEAGDGTYSFSLILSAADQPGTYIFTFYMRDKVGQLAGIKTDSLEVF